MCPWMWFGVMMMMVMMVEMDDANGISQILGSALLTAIRAARGSCTASAPILMVNSS